MAHTLRLCSFNIENLFTRHNFDAFSNDRDRRYLPPIVSFLADFGGGDLSKFNDFKQLVQTASVSQDDDKRQHTALALAQAEADVYCLQEVDSFDALTRFWNHYVKKIGVADYPNVILHEGNDRRGIDVAAITRDIRPTYSRSHASLTAGDLNDTASGKALLADYPEAAKLVKDRGRVFSRDCLELEVVLGDKRVTIFVCHFKSMSDGREKTMPVRQLESIAVREIINRKFADPANALWAVCGDLNDYRTIIKISKGTNAETVEELTPSQKSGIDPLLQDGFGVNVMNLVPAADRWTHYYSGKRHKTQIDHVITSPLMATKVVGMPQIIRAGLPFRVPNTDAVTRFPRVGWDRPKASDHCPVVVEFRI